MNLDFLKLLKIEYHISSNDLDNLLADKMTDKEKKWAQTLSKTYPNESILTFENKVLDFLLIDDETHFRVKKMLDRIGVKYVVEDITNEYVDGSKKISGMLKEQLDTFIIKNTTIDDVLDRINEVGIEKISSLEKKFLELHDRNNK